MSDKRLTLIKYDKINYLIITKEVEKELEDISGMVGSLLEEYGEVSLLKLSTEEVQDLAMEEGVKVILMEKFEELNVN